MHCTRDSPIRQRRSCVNLSTGIHQAMNYSKHVVLIHTDSPWMPQRWGNCSLTCPMLNFYFYCFFIFIMGSHLASLALVHCTYTDFHSFSIFFFSCVKWNVNFSNALLRESESLKWDDSVYRLFWRTDFAVDCWGKIAYSFKITACRPLVALKTVPVCKLVPAMPTDIICNTVTLMCSQ